MNILFFSNGISPSIIKTLTSLNSFSFSISFARRFQNLRYAQCQYWWGDTNGGLNNFWRRSISPNGWYPASKMARLFFHPSAHTQRYANLRVIALGLRKIFLSGSISWYNHSFTTVLPLLPVMPITSNIEPASMMRRNFCKTSKLFFNLQKGFGIFLIINALCNNKTSYTFLV